MSKQLELESLELAFLAGYVEAKGMPKITTNQSGRYYLWIGFRASKGMRARLQEVFGGKESGKSNKYGRWWVITGSQAETMLERLESHFTPGRKKTVREIIDTINQRNSGLPTKKRGRPRRLGHKPLSW